MWKSFIALVSFTLVFAVQCDQSLYYSVKERYDQSNIHVFYTTLYGGEFYLEDYLNIYEFKVEKRLLSGYHEYFLIITIDAEEQMQFDICQGDQVKITIDDQYFVPRIAKKNLEKITYASGSKNQHTYYISLSDDSRLLEAFKKGKSYTIGLNLCYYKDPQLIDLVTANQEQYPLKHRFNDKAIGAIKALLSENLQINKETPEFQLYLSAKNNDASAATALLNTPVNIDYAGPDGNTALIYFTFHQNVEMVSLLITKGANVNIQGEYGKTALYVAIGINNVELVKILLVNGADMSIPAMDGMTAYGYAHLIGNVEMVIVLDKFRDLKAKEK